jgi:hypothetical protein
MSVIFALFQVIIIPKPSDRVTLFFLKKLISRSSCDPCRGPLRGSAHAVRHMRKAGLQDRAEPDTFQQAVPRGKCKKDKTRAASNSNAI